MPARAAKCWVFPTWGGRVRFNTVPSVSIFSSNPLVDRFEALSSDFTGTGVSSCRAIRPPDHLLGRSV